MASSLRYHVTIDAEAARKMMATGSAGFPSVVNRLLLDAGYYVRNEVSERAPRGVGGSNGRGLTKSVTVTLDRVKHEAEIKPTAPYAEAVEFGSRPHRPPTHPNSALAQWCEMKGLNLWAVASSIARKGTRPHPYVEPAYRASEPHIQRIFNEGVEQYLRRLENDRL